ncbi:orotate phosphoribosyltransferase [Luteitalea sp. TBR-22]|uniref:orotate phosphoribosyltransferase n=1 Tax=Luteitalea sp. TBR-22 TaxID=2802971 RepID=UPI001AFBEE16|nr:orotate phosphoribosyltransferase [Luteitalea sp. TBR-22]BCS31533.1 orotate phosphoribosyltransferase [Luteitalea sp. TBR-22]
MTPDSVLALFRQRGALLEGHFVLSSGLHSTGYLQCALILQHPADAEALGRALAEKVKAAGHHVDVVLSPAMGGLIIGHEVGRALGVRAIFAERVDGRLTLRRGFQLQAGERVLVVEDVVTTGKSTLETVAVAEQAGAVVVAAASIINRGGGDGMAIPYVSLAEAKFPTFAADAIPADLRDVPAVKPGSRPGLK